MTTAALLLPRFLTRAEVAQLCHVTAQTVTAWTRTGKLPQPKRIGKKHLYDAQDVLRRLETEPKSDSA